MQTISDSKIEAVTAITGPKYEAPRIETILTPEALEREVHYAGGPVVVSPVST